MRDLLTINRLRHSLTSFFVDMPMNEWIRHFSTKLILPLLALLLLPVIASAQTVPPDTDIQDVEVRGGSDMLRLETYFLSRDGVGDAVLERPQAVTYRLEDGTTYPAEISTPPFYIALVLDASGSLQDVLPEMKEAARLAVSEAPEQASFAVLQFSESIELVQSFTHDRESVLRAIDSIQASEGGTCLYDVGYATVQSLNQITAEAPLRAMVILTDGEDELASGTAEPCSENTFGQLLRLAGSQESLVPIHMMPFGRTSREINLDVITDLAENTDGLVAQDDPETWSNYFEDIYESLQGLWVANGEVFLETAGQHILTLEIVGSSGLSHDPDSIYFASDREYPAPVEVVEIEANVELLEVGYNPFSEQIDAIVRLDEPALVGYLRFEIWDGANPVFQQIISGPNPFDVIELTPDNLIPDRVYTMRVIALDLRGTELQKGGGQQIFSDKQFDYDPPLEVSISVEGISATLPIYNLDAGVYEQTVQFDVAAENEGRINHYEYYVTQHRDFVLPGDIDEDGIVVSMQEESEGEVSRQVVVRAFDSDGRELASDLRTFRLPVADEFDWLWVGIAVGTFVVGLMIGFLLRLLVTRRTITRLEDAQMDTLRVGVITVVRSLDKEAEGKQIWLDEPTFVIGRSAEASLSLPDDRHVSREHVAILREDNLYYIYDRDSANHTFVNGLQVAAETPVRLEDGQEIIVGKTTYLRFEMWLDDRSGLAETDTLLVAGKRDGETTVA